MRNSLSASVALAGLAAFASMARAEPGKVDLDNYALVETHRQMAITQANAGGVNTFDHKREVPPVDNQPVVRMNRDTLYSMAIIDASKGATVTLPDAGDRYISLTYLDENHRVYDMVYEAGEHEIPAPTGHMYALVRVGVKSGTSADLAEIHRIQDAIKLSANSSVPFEAIEYDEASYQKTHHGVLDSFAKSGLLDTEKMFGTEDYVDHDRCIMGTAIGWGGATWKDNIYQFSKFFEGEECQSTTFVDPKNEGGCWSITVYNKGGFMFDDVANINSEVAEKNADGTYTVSFNCEGGINNLPIKNDSGAWNAAMRHYTPSEAVVNGSITPMKTIAPVK